MEIANKNNINNNKNNKNNNNNNNNNKVILRTAILRNSQSKILVTWQFLNSREHSEQFRAISLRASAISSLLGSKNWSCRKRWKK